MTPPAPAVVELYSDIACPWCYIGERRLFDALRRRPDVEIRVRWRPFQLQPALPPEGIAWEEFVRAKFGGQERAAEMFAHVAAAGLPDGIAFDFENVAAAVNTGDAHRLILFARELECEWPVARSLFAAYFEQGRNIVSREVLVTLAAESGLDGDAVAAWLASDGGRREVEISQRHAEAMGITGVPFFIFDRRFAVSGAQPAEVFEHALDELVNVEAGA
jgi:predicted DsbA family dithiol-disulfide isomerase